MSPEDLGSQLNAAYLERLVNHTVTQLDQVVRDREEQTPEVEFSGEHPLHSFKFECKQISAWFQNEEVDTLRKTIQNTHYWTQEARALLHLLMRVIYGSLTHSCDGIASIVGLIGDELVVDEMGAVTEEITRIHQYADHTMAQFRACIESKWASENARTAGHWQDDISTLHRVAEWMGIKSTHIQKARHDITDEQYWQFEVQVLKPHRLQHEYNIQQSARERPHYVKPALSAEQSARALRAHTRSLPGNPAQKKEQGARIAKTRSSTLKSKPPSERRRSARLQQLAGRAQRQRAC